MHVIKRNGGQEPVQLDKIVRRIAARSSGLAVEPIAVAQKVINGIYDCVTTRELDNLAVQTAAGLVTTHPDYGLLAARISASILHKETDPSFAATIEKLHARTTSTGRHAPAVSDELLEIVRAHKHRIESELRIDRDFEFDYMGIATLRKGYLLELDGKIVERPQYLWMRVALGIHGWDLDSAFETYHLMSTKKFTHATPTLFNAGSQRPQMSSCFLLHMHDDSIPGIYKTLMDCALISQYAGGIGVHVHNIRAAGSPIAGTGGVSNGLVPMLRNFDATASYVDQGGGKRKGSFAIYLEPWHADIYEFLDLKKNTGKDEVRCRALFYGMWTPDLFMKRVQADSTWSLFDPARCPGLSDCYGEEFDALYTRYEAEGKAVRTVQARDLFKKICDVQVETSMPYMMYKDSINRKSNQQNLGTIKSSNLCTEITQFTSPKEIAVCNLASVSLPAYVKNMNTYFDHEELHKVVKVAVRNLNKVIDRNHYPVKEAEVSNMLHRPIGIGVQGLADVFIRMGAEWGDELSMKLNREIFETIYHAACEASMELALKDGPYSTFEGSPAHAGKLQFDLWADEGRDPLLSGRYNWGHLKELIAKHGLRNSLLVAPMPTASTANIFGNTEGFEAVPSNLYKRTVLSGEFVVLNSYLVHDLIKLGLWNESMKEAILAAEGSVQHITAIPEKLRNLYKTVYEIKQRIVIDMAAERGRFVDQSQSMSIYMKDATYSKLSAMHQYGWEAGLKTGSYYIRQPDVVTAKKITNVVIKDPVRDAKDLLLTKGATEADFVGMPPEDIITWAQGTCSRDNPGDCIMCSG
jgi:ribonucleoside-diphosphate reductase alpha chain